MYKNKKTYVKVTVEGPFENVCLAYQGKALQSNSSNVSSIVIFCSTCTRGVVNVLGSTVVNVLGM